MELICPSCEARYGIPDGSIGEKGRQVSCMNCGHGWHAFPPLVLGAEQAAGSSSAGMRWQHPGPVQDLRRTEPTLEPTRSPSYSAPYGSSSGANGSNAASVGTPITAAASSTDARVAASRSEQLAEIREMLAEVQSEDRAVAAARSDTTSTFSDAADEISRPLEQPEFGSGEVGRSADLADRDENTTRVFPESEQSVYAEEFVDPEPVETDPLRQRMQMAGGAAAAKAKPTDVKKLRKTHDRKVRRHKRQEAAGSGAFLTGFLLVAIIASVMISLYLLHPQIIERVPASEPALIEYVATIDGLRVTVAETYEGITNWVSESLEGKV